MFLPLSDKQFEFWRLRRSGLPNINIARLFKISKQAVSRAILTMDERIEKTLLEMARANQIEVKSVNAQRGGFIRPLRASQCRCHYFHLLKARDAGMVRA